MITIRRKALTDLYACEVGIRFFERLAAAQGRKTTVHFKDWNLKEYANLIIQYPKAAQFLQWAMCSNRKLLPYVPLAAAAFRNVDLTELAFSSVVGAGNRFERTVLWGMRWTNCDVPRTVFQFSSMREAGLLICDLRNSAFVHCDATRATFHETSLREVTFLHTCLTEARFTFCGLGRTSFRHCDLTNARFEGSDISQADFTYADLTGAVISPVTTKPPVGWKRGKEGRLVRVGKSRS